MTNQPQKPTNRFELVRIEIIGHDDPRVEWKSLKHFPSLKKAQVNGRLSVHNNRHLYGITYPKKEFGLDKEKICAWFLENFESGTYQGYFIVLEH